MNRIPGFKSRLTRLSRHAQSGQVIILMAFGMMALLAVLGLAIDGGRLYFLERDAQNASDAAVLAATHALCTNAADPQQAAMDAAAANGFVASEVIVRQPEASALLDPGANPDDYVEVIISADIPSYFIHLVYGGDLGVSTYALGHCTVAWNPYTDGRAIISTHDCTDCNVSFKINGGRDIHIRGGVLTNGNIASMGNNHVIEGPVDFGTRCEVSANRTTFDTGEPVCMTAGEIAEVPELYRIEDFRPDGQIYNEYYPQGLYHVVSGNINLDEYPDGGIFYSAGNLGINHSYEGDNWDDIPAVTIVAEGNIHMRGHVNRLKGLYDNGLVMFTTVGNGECRSNLGIDISGSDTAWLGLIYAPNSHVSIPGSSATTSWGAIIADTVSVTGSQAQIYYDASYLPDPQTAIAIAQ